MVGGRLLSNYKKEEFQKHDEYGNNYFVLSYHGKLTTKYFMIPENIILILSK